MSLKKERVKRAPSLFEALLVFAVIIAVIIYTLSLKVGMQTPMILGCTIAAIFAVYLGFSWKEIEEGIFEGMKTGFATIPILFLVGMLVGIWILGGTVPSIIYYGLKYINPSIMVPLTFVLCAITSLATGTSFGSIATVGLALFGVGIGLNIPGELMAGAIASGAFFGDKMSPLSDTTNIAPAMAGSNLYEHIGSMMWTTVPATVICIILYTVLGLKYGSGNVDMSSVNLILNTLDATFNISLIAIIPPIIVIALSVKKVPAMKSLMIGVIISAIFAMFTQSVSFNELIKASMQGFSSNTGVDLVDKILNRGGINMMAGTITMLIAATAMGGVMEKCQILNVCVASLLKVVKTSTGLILSTVVATAATVAASGNMALALILPGRTFKPAYEKMDVHPKVLSRTLEDIGTLGHVLIPWTNPSLFLQGALGIGAGYIKFTFLSMLVPVFTILFAFTSFAVWNIAGEPLWKNKKITSKSK